jgi:TonB-linked SusC/RagA family outer membrane protein
MQTRKMLSLLALLCGLATCAWGQKISGTVFDRSTQQAVIGATVAVSKTHGTITNEKGQFSLEVPAGTSSLQISFIGYKTQTIILDGATSYNVQLESDGRSLEEYVAVGYGSQRKVNLTGAVTTVDVSKTFVSRPLTDASKALQGVVPGLTITYGNGGLTTSPGINIRGVGSVNGASRPLILVDNVETSDLTLINPTDIESVSVLKDAASASIYGARAAFGVVLIKTKSGLRNMKTTVSYSNNFSWNTYTRLPDFADPVKELTGIIEGAQRAGTAEPELFGMKLATLRDGIANWQKNFANNRTSNEMVLGEDFEKRSDGRMYFYRVWDVKDMMLKKWTPQQIHDLKVQGGSEKIGYYLSAGYSQQGGILKMNPDNVKKYNIIGGLDASVTKWLDVRARMLYRNFEYEYPYDYQAYWYYMWRWGAYFPFGTYQGKHFRHVPAYLAGAQKAELQSIYQRIDLGATIKINKHLNIRADYTIGRDNPLRHEVGGPVMAWDFWGNGSLANIASASQNDVEYRSGRYKVNTLNAYATYEKTFPGKHKVKLMAGVNAEENETINITANSMGLLDPAKGELPLATGAKSVDGNHLNDAYAGYFSRINYTYKDKWMLELNGRYDGSSAFPDHDKWAFFPSGSVGYRITEEPFMQSLRRTLSDMKLRASYGTLGNQDVGDKYFIPAMPVVGNMYWVTPDNMIAPGIGAPRAVAESITWEKVKMLNLGTDISLLNNRIGITFDWFERNTTGMLANKGVGATFGTEAPKVNSGNMRTRGWEISIDGTYNFTSDLAVYGIATLADSRSIITKWDNPSMLLNQNYAGKTIGEIWGFETDRYFTKEDDMENKGSIPDQRALANGNFVYGPGDIKYKDLNGDSVINGGKASALDHGDLKVIGNSQPRYQYSFRIGGSWKNIDLDVFFQGVGKRELWGWGDVAIPMYRGSDIMYDHQLDYWTETNTGARYPRPYSANTTGKISGLQPGGNNFYPQTKYLLNLAYLRLKNVTLGYSFSPELLKRIRLQKLRVYVSGQNIADIISHVGIPLDPEITTGESDYIGRTFPFQRSYSFGVQVIL